MKNIKTIILFLLFGLYSAAGLTAQPRLIEPNDPDAVAGSGQAEIIINAKNATRNIAVWVNGEIAAHVRPKAREKIIVNNGQNEVGVAVSAPHWNRWGFGKRKTLTVYSNSNCTVIRTSTRYGKLLNLLVQNTTALGEGGALTPLPRRRVETLASPVTVTDPSSSGRYQSLSLENAVYRAAETIITSIHDGSTLAVLNIATNDPDMADFIIEELAYIIVTTRRFKVVDRRSLEAVRAEANFQYSGDVDDSSAVTIGKLLGADIVITGSISGAGSTRRLRVKALDVQTAEIVAMASERH